MELAWINRAAFFENGIIFRATAGYNDFMLLFSLRYDISGLIYNLPYFMNE